MSIDLGTEYQIAAEAKDKFNSAQSLTVIRNNGTTIQFTLKDGKGHGSMPIQHMDYLLKRNEITQIKSSKRGMLQNELEEEQIV